MSPIMLDLAGCELTPEEKEVLDHPLVGGVILFTRNYHDQKQLAELTKQTRANARNDLLVAVDHEGGRVQRFRDGFSLIPAMGSLRDKCVEQGGIEQACQFAKAFGWLMAAEVQAFDIDISFAPVLDVNGISEVIGDRSFSQQPDELMIIAEAFIQGMHEAGMKTTGKHFPGHGSVREDSHFALPIDSRSHAEIFELDMQIFEKMHQKGLLDAVMPAHVIYSQVDEMPAGFSKVWIQQILRKKMQFDGVVFSDDLAMEGATGIGGFTERAVAALEAGCDMALVCNNPQGAMQILDELPESYINSQSQVRVKRMQKQSQRDWATLQKQSRWNETQRQLEAFYER